MQKNRSVEEVLRGLLGSGFIGNQEQLRQALKANNVFVTQSTVSRALKKIGAFRTLEGGEKVYQVQKVKTIEAKFSNFKELIVDVSSNEYTIVVKTIPGSAMFVAGFLDHNCRDFILGTVAGDDTILIAPKSVQTISSAKNKIRSIFGKGEN